MLGKLCKNEIKATARWFIPLFIITLLLSIGSRLTYRYIDVDTNPFIQLLSGIISIGFILSIIVIFAASTMLIVYRFYKNMVTEEGYLTHTLPVTMGQLIWTKMLTAAVWSVASVAVVLLAILVMVYEPGMLSDFASSFSEAWGILLAEAGAGEVAEVGIELFLLFAIAIITSPLIFYASIAIGQLFSNHKIIGSVAGYFGINIATQILLTAFFMIVTPYLNRLSYQNLSSDITTALSHLLLPLIIVGYSLFNAVLYFITWFILKNKLNLD